MQGIERKLGNAYLLFPKITNNSRLLSCALKYMVRCINRVTHQSMQTVFNLNFDFLLKELKSQKSNF